MVKKDATLTGSCFNVKLINVILINLMMNGSEGFLFQRDTSNLMMNESEGFLFQRDTSNLMMSESEGFSLLCYN